jgi:hypothetical protein
MSTGLSGPVPGEAVLSLPEAGLFPAFVSAFFYFQNFMFIFFCFVLPFFL